jgi:RNA polymerase primary sigma factor
MAIRPLVITERITKRESDSFKRYLTEVDTIKRLTVDEEYEVSLRAMDGDEHARNELISKNLRFVISVAKQYANNDARLEELVQEGNIGLAEAAKRYDPKLGFKFISYAVWWIRRCIMEYLTKKSRTIRIPSNQAANITKLTEIVNGLEQKLERRAEKHELADILDGEYSDKEIDFFMSLDKTNTLSLDKPFGEDSDGDLKSTLPSNAFEATDYSTKVDDNKHYVESLLKLLPKEQQRLVLIRVYGLDGKEPLSLKEVADDFGLTRERVRQVKDNALRILKMKVNINKLKYIFEK